MTIERCSRAMAVERVFADDDDRPEPQGFCEGQRLY
jgi:hypothetical protein